MKKAVKKKSPKKPAKKKAAVKSATSFKKPKTKPKGPSFDNEALLQLAEQLLPGDKKYADEVRLAIQAPADYVEKFADELEMRGIDEPIPELAWIALTDGLVRRQRLTYLDWRFMPEELSEGIDEQIRARKAKKVDWRFMGEEDPAEECLAGTAKALGTQGFALLTLDNLVAPEDAYPVLLLEEKRVATAQQLAKRTGYGAIAHW